MEHHASNETPILFLFDLNAEYTRTQLVTKCGFLLCVWLSLVHCLLTAFSLLVLSHSTLLYLLYKPL